jgi:hypothetical protein
MELVYRSSYIWYVFGAVILTELMLPHSKLLLKVAPPIGIIFPCPLSSLRMFLLASRMLKEERGSDVCRSSRRCF